MPYKDPVKQREAEARYHRENRSRRRDGKKDRRSHFRRLIQEFKSVPCADCGMSYPYYVMDFDHVRGAKCFNIGTDAKSKSMEAFLAEVAKCDVVCANCHRHRTWMRLTH